MLDCASMFWNITIAVILALLAVVDVRASRTAAATKRWQKWLFWGAGFLMVILIGVQTCRNEEHKQTQRSSSMRFKRIQRHPPTVNVTVPPAAPAPVQPRRSAGFLQFEKTEFQ